MGDQGVFLTHFEEEIQDPGLHYDLVKTSFSLFCLRILLDRKEVIQKYKTRKFVFISLSSTHPS